MKRSVLLLALLGLAACDGAADPAPVAVAGVESCVLPTDLPAPRRTHPRQVRILPKSRDFH